MPSSSAHPMMIVISLVVVLGVAVTAVFIADTRRPAPFNPDTPYRTEAMRAVRAINGAATTFGPDLSVFRKAQHVAVCGTLQRHTMDDRRRFAVIFEPGDAMRATDHRQTVLVEGSPIWARETQRYGSACR